ncbi:endothelial differentiation-related factor 1 homolog [Oscarella lobularis]|uniref:endothelial differentiation-related factor 1 homolog n=1 Tax=Oscarella lobularis TaxID=121494 RepID=UPI0033133D10
MAETDWDTVTYLRKKAPTASQTRSAKAVNAAQRQGAEIETSKKCKRTIDREEKRLIAEISVNAATNKQKSSARDTAKLDRETEELHHDRVPLDVGRAIMKARGEKKLSQKELATKINEKPNVVNDYEAGRAIPNQQIMSKLERVLGVKLRGKSIGEPLSTKKK